MSSLSERNLWTLKYFLSSTLLWFGGGVYSEPILLYVNKKNIYIFIDIAQYIHDYEDQKLLAAKSWLPPLLQQAERNIPTKLQIKRTYM